MLNSNRLRFHYGCFFFVFLPDGHADVHRTEQREDERLDERHQQLHQTHEDVEEDGDRRDRPTDGRVHLPEDENQRHERQGDDVAGGDVGEKSHHQHERLGEDADGLHQRHDRQWELQPPRHARRVEDVFPVLLAGREGGHEEGDERENARHGDVAGEVRAARENRDDAQHVVQEDEEEQREQIRCVFVGVFAQRRGDDFVLDEHDDRLHKGLQAARCLVRVLFVALRHRQENARYQNDGDEQGADVLGNGNIPLADVVRINRTLFKMSGEVGIVALQPHDAALVVAPAHGIAVVGGLAVVELVRQKADRTAFVEQDDGQRNSDALFATAADVPAVAVDDVLDDERAGIETLRLFRDIRVGRNRLRAISRGHRVGLRERILARKDRQQCAKKHRNYSSDTFITHTSIVSYINSQNLSPLNLKSRAIYDFLDK